MNNKSKKRRDDIPENDKTIRKRSEKILDENQEENDEDRSNILVINGEELEFEDPFGDDYEEEYIEEEDDDDVELVDNFDDNDNGSKGIISSQQSSALATVEKVERDSNDDVSVEKKQVWRPGIDQLADGEELEYDPRAYVMYHSLRAEWPCLSFDFLKDNLGEGRLRFPMTMYMVTGSQADQTDRNKITLLKLSDLNKTGGTPASDDDSENNDDSESDDDNMDDDPTLEHVDIPHIGGINRIRSMPQKPGIVATWADTSHTHIFDISSTYQSMLAKGPRVLPPITSSFTFKGHKDEGFALDWSPVVTGRLATGDCAGAIHIWNNADHSTWQVDNKPYLGHKSSVEDIQWSPTESSVFISASSDKTVRIWDTRGRNGPQITVDAHNEDVNVISWNRNVAYLLASGSDDGSFKVWDLRSIKKSTTLASFNYHKGPITSIEWAPHDESVIALSSADNQLTIWDLSVEDDPSSQSTDPSLAAYPAQLLFIHQGQHNMKELHHHPQIPGVIFSTAEDGFNVFKPAISVSS